MDHTKKATEKTGAGLKRLLANKDVEEYYLLTTIFLTTSVSVDKTKDFLTVFLPL